MADEFRQTHGTIVFHPEEREKRWSAPNPEHELYADARYRARYPKPGQEPNYLCATLADTYAYLVSGCLTTKGACEQLRMIRRAVKAAATQPASVADGGKEEGR